MSGGGGKGPLSEINVTPLVDVMLVLLIIFMVAAPMMTTGVTVNLPAAHAPVMNLEEEHLLLSISAEQEIYLGEDKVTFEDLEAALLNNPILRQKSEIYVQADETVPYGFVVKVLALIRKAGVGTMGLVTDPLASD